MRSVFKNQITVDTCLASFTYSSVPNSKYLCKILTCAIQYWYLVTILLTPSWGT